MTGPRSNRPSRRTTSTMLERSFRIFSQTPRTAGPPASLRRRRLPGAANRRARHHQEAVRRPVHRRARPQPAALHRRPRGLLPHREPLHLPAQQLAALLALYQRARQLVSRPRPPPRPRPAASPADVTNRRSDQAVSVATPTAPTRRGVEATLLVFAIVLAMAAYAAVGLAVDSELPPDLLTYGAGLGALVLVAHLVVRRVAPYADPLLLPAVTALNGLGLVLIYRLDLSEAERARQNGRAAPSEDVQLQLAWTAVGIGFFVLVLIVVRNHRSLGRYAYTSMFVGIGLLALPALLPARFSEVNGARIWIRAFGFSIQPGEFAKLLLIIFFAGYLMAKRDVLALASRRVL